MSSQINDAAEMAKASELTLGELIELCQNKISDKDYRGALEILIPASELTGNSDRLPLEGLKADCYRGLYDIASARQCYEKIFEIEPQPPNWVFVGYGNVLEISGEHKLAIKQMFSALKMEFSVELAKRLVHLKKQNIEDFVQQYMEQSDESLAREELYELAESLILDGYESKGKCIFESLERISSDDLSPTRKLVGAYMKTGNTSDAITAIVEWQSRNPDDQQLDQLLKTCRDSGRLDVVAGLPRFLVGEERDLSEFTLKVNGITIHSGLNRYSRVVKPSIESGSESGTIERIINVPSCYVDSKSEKYKLTVTENSGANHKYEKYYATSTLCGDNSIYQGNFDYKGDGKARGWLYSEIDDCQKIELYLNDQYIKDVNIEKRRRDVANRLGDDALFCGFDCEWDESIDVRKLEFRDAQNGRSVLGTPIYIQKRVNAVTELEKLLLNTESSERVFANNTVSRIFEAVRSTPEVTTESADSSLLSRYFEEGVSVIVPIYNAIEDVYRCITSILNSDNGTPYEIVCINDCSPDERVLTFLEPLAEKNENICLVNSEVNRGFVKTVNKGLAARRYRNVIILNSDTVVPAQFIDRLQATYESNKNFGVITPLSNNATIFSFPLSLKNNRLDSLDEINDIDNLLRSNELNTVHEVPTGHGYCMFVPGVVLERVGYFDEEEWGVGYGEENDFCQRVKMQGWQIGAHLGMYVGHIGSVSFGDEQRESQVRKNLMRLNEIYPEYDDLIENHIENEKDSRRTRNKLQILNWIRKNPDDVFLLISHSLGGGTTEYIERCVGRISDENIHSLLLTTDSNKLVICDLDKSIYCVYEDDEVDLLKSHLNLFSFKSVVINSTFNYPVGLFEKFTGIVENYTVVLHDYSWFCPKINMIDSTGKYCGMPSSEVCVNCIKTSGSHKSFAQDWKNISTGLDLWLTKNLLLLENAQLIIAPSHDAADRIKRKFPSLNPTVKYHEDSIEMPISSVRFTANTLEQQTIGVFGMIGDHKGLQLIKNLCWLLSLRHPGIKLVFFGALSEYDWMEDYSNVKCVGEYDQENLGELIQQEKPTASLFLSPWPETYCYALTDAIRHAVFPIAFDIGAFAERIKMHNYGEVIPFKTDCDSIYSSIVEVLSGSNFQNASAADIKSGVSYENFSNGYLQLKSTVQIKSAA